MDKALLQKIENRKALIGVIGLGYVGLPLVRAFCKAGFKCLGYDIDPKKVKAINAGKSYIKHIPTKDISPLVKGKKLRATDKARELRKADALLICVPTPLTKMREPDMSYITTTCEMLAPHIQKGQLVVLESTTYPGTTREVMKPILEKSGLKAEKDFFLAFSPEREDPGRKDFITETTPKVVGGYGPKSRKVSTALYAAAISKAVSVSSCEIAESAKIIENVFRAVNIAMVNELKVLFDRMDINVWEVIDAASTKPFGFMPFYPGPGLGGHCIPIDPFYLTWKAREFDMSTRFIELAGEINTSMPHYVITKVMEGLNNQKKSLNGSKVLVLGLAYKKDIDDVRESPSCELIELLREHGAKVDYNDPFIPQTHEQREYNLKLKSKKITPAMIKSYDCVLISTDHSCYDYNMIVKNAKLVVDTRNATAKIRSGRSKIVRA